MHIPVPKPKKDTSHHYKKCGYCKKPVHMDEAWIKYVRTSTPPYKSQRFYHKECYEKSIAHGFPQGVGP